MGKNIQFDNDVKIWYNVTVGNHTIKEFGIWKKR